MIIIHTTWGYIGLALMLSLTFAVGVSAGVLLAGSLDNRRIR